MTARVRQVGSTAGSVQAKFTPDSKFSGNDKLVKALELLNGAIDQMPGSNIAKLRNSPTLDVQFTAGALTESKAHSSIDVPDPGKEGALCPLASVAQYHRLVGSTEVHITMEANSSSQRSYFIQARTLAHELAGHIAPYVDILEKIKAGTGMSEADQDRVLNGSRGGALEHAGMVRGGNAEYDSLVQRMARSLSPSEGLEMAQSYLEDISRYDPKSGAVLGEKEKEQFIKQFQQAKEGIDWISELTAAHAERRRQLARRRNARNLFMTIILIAIVAYVLKQVLA